jgi:hypothetical protein
MLLLFPLVLFAIAIGVLSYLAHIIDNPAKSLNIAVQADEMGNVALNGRLNQSLSYRAALAMVAKKRWGCWLCACLDAVVPNHCKDQLKP